MNRAEPDISFRRITPEDAENLVRWQSEEEVAAWWWDHQDEPRDKLIGEWVANLFDPTDETARYVISVDGHDIGEIQDYKLADYPEAAAEVGISNSAGVDMLIGEPGWRNRGIGTAVLRKYVDEVVFSRPRVETCIIDPHPENKRAIRCYEKVGFKYVRTFHSVSNKVDVYLMRLDR